MHLGLFFNPLINLDGVIPGPLIGCQYFRQTGVGQQRYAFPLSGGSPGRYQETQSPDLENPWTAISLAAFKTAGNVPPISQA